MSTPLELASDQSQRQNGRTRRANLVIGLVLSAATLFICLGGMELAGFIWERKTAEGPLGWSLVASRRLHFERRGEEQTPYYLSEPGRHYLW